MHLFMLYSVDPHSSMHELRRDNSKTVWNTRFTLLPHSYVNTIRLYKCLVLLCEVVSTLITKLTFQPEIEFDIGSVTVLHKRIVNHM